MSRIAKNPVVLPKGVEVALAAGEITIKGPLGVLTQFVLPSVKLEKEGEAIVCRAIEGQPNASAMSGTMRALVNNMVTGVSKGFEKKLTLVGVGYKAQAQGSKLNLSLGFSHPIVHEMPNGIKVETPTQLRLSSRESIVSWLGRLQPKCVLTAPLSPIRVRVSAMRMR